MHLRAENGVDAPGERRQIVEKRQAREVIAFASVVVAALATADEDAAVMTRRGLRMFTKVATVFMNAATAEQSCKALRLRLSGTPPRGAVYPAGV